MPGQPEVLVVDLPADGMAATRILKRFYLDHWRVVGVYNALVGASAILERAPGPPPLKPHSE